MTAAVASSSSLRENSERPSKARAFPRATWSTFGTGGLRDKPLPRLGETASFKSFRRICADKDSFPASRARKLRSSSLKRMVSGFVGGRPVRRFLFLDATCLKSSVTLAVFSPGLISTAPGVRGGRVAYSVEKSLYFQALKGCSIPQEFGKWRSMLLHLCPPYNFLPCKSHPTP